MLPLTTRLAENAFLVVDTEVLKVLEYYRQLNPNDKEAGGILIGSYRNRHIHVVKATTPGIRDTRSRYGFHRRSLKHQTIALSAWLGSSSTLTFIGEWHTHPEDYPAPSRIDIDEWKKHAQKQPLIMIIEGRVDRWLGICIEGTIQKVPC